MEMRHEDPDRALPLPQDAVPHVSHEGASPGCLVLAMSDQDRFHAEVTAQAEQDEIVWACYCGNDVPPGVNEDTFWCRECGELGRVRAIWNNTGEPVEEHA
jgi:hypothetical protein